MRFATGANRGLVLALVALFVLMGVTKQAVASGDGGCSAVWRVIHRQYEGCSNMALLSPSNDTRVNLLLLMADLRMAKTGVGAKVAGSGHDSPLFLWDELAARLEPQSAASSEGEDDFSAAVEADHDLKPEERAALLALRAKPAAGATTDAASNAIALGAKMTTASAKAYAKYLEAAGEFNDAKFDTAAGTFSTLAKAQPAWVRETAMYMVGRSLINFEQSGAFDEYGAFKTGWHSDAKASAEAEAALDRYLQQYPKGAYAKSARGLKRRGYWLAQDMGKLVAEYGALVLLSPEERNVSDVELAQEIDNKITTPTNAFGDQTTAVAGDDLVKLTQSPLLLAMFDLEEMRETEADSASAARANGGRATEGMPLAELQQQRPYFATQMPLYEYLLAVHAFYVENKPAEVLRLIPDAARQSSFSYVQFSRQMLRGLALEAVKDRNALGLWKEMLPGAKAAYERPALELAIAYHEERAEEIRNVFAAGSPVHDPYLREVLLSNVADADLLRVQAANASVPKHERDVALFTLLYKEATLGQPAAFVKDLALVPPTAPSSGYFALDYSSGYNLAPDEKRTLAAIPLGIFLHGKADNSYGCPALRVSEEQLAQDAGNATAQLCVAEFVRLNTALSTKPGSDEVGGTPPLFPGGDYVRMATYTSVMTSAKAGKNDKAYALYRAVNCYAPSGNNDCGGKDVPVAQRKAWFTTLKRDYAGTKWANALQYYW